MWEDLLRSYRFTRCLLKVSMTNSNVSALKTIEMFSDLYILDELIKDNDKNVIIWSLLKKLLIISTPPVQVQVASTEFQPDLPPPNSFSIFFKHICLTLLPLLMFLPLQQIPPCPQQIWSHSPYITLHYTNLTLICVPVMRSWVYLGCQLSI